MTTTERSKRRSERLSSSFTINETSSLRKAGQCSRLCIVVSTVVGLLAILALGLCLGLLLNKNSSGTTTGRAALLRWNSSGTTIAGLGSGGNYSNALAAPYGFVWDESHTLYIAENTGNRVTKWIPGAPAGTVIAGLANGTASNASNGFYRPVAIYRESNGDMYVTDRSNYRFQFWPNGATSGVTVLGKASCG